MVCVLNISVDETVNLQVHCPTWVRDWLRRYDEGGLEGLRDLLRCGQSRRILQTVKCYIVSTRAMNPIPLPSLHLQQAIRMSRALPGGVFLIMRQIFSLLASGVNSHPFENLASLQNGSCEGVVQARDTCPDQNFSGRCRPTKTMYQANGSTW